MNTDIDRFYDLLRSLETQPGQGQRLSQYTARPVWPTRGVYFFREPGESRRTQPSFLRVVRVGTHAVSTNSKSTLWARLRTHRGGQNGGGNHRGSIFRLHAGAALLERDRESIGEMPTWGQGSSAPRVIRDSETAHERRVSAHLGSMSVLWVEIPDEASPQSSRAYIERNAIGLLSNNMRPFDPPSKTWLGLHSPRPEIRNSGLWNLNYVHEQYDPAFLDALAAFVSQTIKRWYMRSDGCA